MSDSDVLPAFLSSSPSMEASWPFLSRFRRMMGCMIRMIESPWRLISAETESTRKGMSSLSISMTVRVPLGLMRIFGAPGCALLQEFIAALRHRRRFLGVKRFQIGKRQLDIKLPGERLDVLGGSLGKRFDNGV